MTKAEVRPMGDEQTHTEAMLQLAEPNYMGSLDYRKKCMGQDRIPLLPSMQQFVAGFLKDARTYNIPLFPEETFRSGYQQAVEYREGRCHYRPGHSPYQTGDAVSMVHAVRPGLTEKEWAMIGQIGQETARRMKIPLVWGGVGGPGTGFYQPWEWTHTRWFERR